MVTGLLDDLDLNSSSLDSIANNITGEQQPETVSPSEQVNIDNVVAEQPSRVVNGSTTESSDEYTLTFNRPDFSKMLGTLAIIQDICNDVEIREGIIRAKTNNNKAIIDINLTSIFQDKNLLISLLKSRLNLLKTFELDMNVQTDGDNTNVILQSDNQKYEFIDCFSKMAFRRPTRKFLDNPYIENDEFNNLTSGCTEENMIFSYTVTPYLKQRLAAICNGFRVDNVKFEFHGNYANLNIETKSKEETSRNTTQIPLIQQIDGKMFSMINMPLMLSIVSEVKISCYKLGGELAMCKSELNHFGIPFVLYSKVKFQTV